MMQHRKKILLAMLGLMLAVYGGDWLWSVVMEPLQEQRQKQRSLERDIEKRSTELAQARKAARGLAALATQSLPADPQVARSAYQAWLLQLVRAAELSNPAVDSTQPSDRGGYSSITFSLQARGTLEMWTRFFFDFYRAGQLHQIRSASFSPTGKKEQLDVMLSIEALVLPGAEQADQLSPTASDRLALQRLEDYQPIVARNLFSISSTADPIDQTFLTAIHSVSGVPEAWFTHRSQAEPDRGLTKLPVGQSLTVGQFTAKVVEITEDDVVLEAAGERWLVTIGQSLGQAHALPPEW